MFRATGTLSCRLERRFGPLVSTADYQESNTWMYFSRTCDEE